MRHPVWCKFLCFYISGIDIAAQAILPIATNFSVAWSVVVCHIRAPCLNRSTDSDAICGVQWYIVLDGGPWPPRGTGDFGVESRRNCQTVSPTLLPGKYKRRVAWTCDSDSAFCRITLVVLANIHRRSSEERGVSLTCLRCRRPVRCEDTDMCPAGRSPTDETFATWSSRATCRTRTTADRRGGPASRRDALCANHHTLTQWTLTSQLIPLQTWKNGRTNFRGDTFWSTL